jgi:Protein of unknown function (DUF3225)
VNLEINIPEIVAEVTEAHKRYEQALSINDLDIIDSLFWNSALTLRYGPNGTLIGHAAISAFRRARNIKGVERTVLNTHVTTFGRDFAVSNTESKRPGTDRTGRQSQTWVRMPEGWRIVSAHVSDEPANR